MTTTDWENIVAVNDLSNIYDQAKWKRFGKWCVSYNDIVVYCYDLLSFYMAAKDIFIRQIYKPNSMLSAPRIIDGGGHIGLFTLYIKRQFPGAHITIFEPDTESLKLLRYNLQTNGILDAVVVDAGLYSEESILSFAGGQSDGSTVFSKQTNATISTVKLSNYIHCEIDFLKLNIEGAELAVLEEVQDKLHYVKELAIEYHGFPETGQNLHKLLAILDKHGFRYLIHDFDGETNPATKPPFHIEKTSRFFLLIYARQLFSTNNEKVHFEDLERHQLSNDIQPLSRKFGYDRGKPIDRHYIEDFLNKNSTAICGRVLEIGDNSYTKKFGTNVLSSDVLNAIPSDEATIVGDLTTGTNIPSAAFDTIIMTQTLNFVYDVKGALTNAYRALISGGNLFITVAGISQISRYDMDRWGDYWRFTNKSLEMLLHEAAPDAEVFVESFGNVAVAKAFIDGLALEDISPEILDYKDKDYQVLLTARVTKPQNSYYTKPVVLIYHRVADLVLDPQLLCVSSENFDAHLNELTHHYRVIPLHQMLAECKHGSIAPGTVSLTFDDGYLDNLVNALPLLEKYEVHATIFVTSGMVGSNEEFWWDALERLFLTTSSLPDTLSFAGHVWHAVDAESRFNVYNAVCSLLRDYPPNALELALEQIFAWAGVSRIGRTSHKILDPHQLQILAASPHIEIGAHAKHHVRLSTLPIQMQYLEVFASRQQLEALIGKPVRLFSYPYGTTADFTRDTVQAVADAGYIAAIANIQGDINLPIDPYVVPRWLVRNWNRADFSAWLRSEDKFTLEALTLQKNRINILQTTIDQYPV